MEVGMHPHAMVAGHAGNGLLLYGVLGPSKAYVIGLCVCSAGLAIYDHLAVCFLIRDGLVIITSS